MKVLVLLLIFYSSFGHARLNEVKTLFRPIDEPQAQISCEKNDEDICANMINHVCKEGTFFDGSGSASSTGGLEEKKHNLKVKYKRIFKEQILKDFNASAKRDFRDLVFAGFRTDPKCSGSCELKIAESYADFFVEKNFPDSNSSIYSNFDIAFLNKLNSHPNNKQLLGLLKTRVSDDVLQKNAYKKISERIFPDVQMLISNLIKDKIKNKDLQASMIKRISSIKFKGADCNWLRSKDEGKEPSVEELFKVNAFYNPQDNSFSYCNGLLLTSDSDFQISYVIAHELAHSLDPCQLPESLKGQFQYSNPSDVQKCEREYPFPGLIECLRSKESVQAIRKNSKDVGMGKVFCNQSDQITEAFADWVGFEVVPRYISLRHSALSTLNVRTGYTNIFRNLCNNSHSGFDEHVELSRKINFLLLTQPQIRRQMKCDGPMPIGRIRC